jgi:ATP-binding cassette subfamily B protein
LRSGRARSDSKGGSRSALPQIRRALRGRSRKVAWLGFTSFAGGLSEAVFLVLVTRTAFAITDDADNVGFIASASLSLPAALAVSLLLVIARVGFGVVGSSQAATLSAAVVRDVRLDLARSFIRASWSSQHGERAGRLQELQTTFAGMGAVLISSIATCISTGVNLLALLLMAVAVDPIASLVVIGAVALLGSVLRPLRSAVRRQAQRTGESGMEFATALSETSQLGLEMHIFGVQSEIEQRIEALIEHDASVSRRLGFLRGLVPSVYSGLAFVALVGGLALAATIDSTDLTSVGAVLLVMLRSLSYGQGLQTSITTINSSLPFVDTLQLELDKYRAAAVADGQVPIGNVGVLNLNSVSFSYVAGTSVLSDVNATIRPHEVIGVVGPSGSGKSTLVQLLLGLREPTSGEVLSDGRDIRTLSRQEWARKVTFVPQHAHLIAGSVADNIRFYRSNVSNEDIVAAARSAHLHDDVVGWREGYERQVGEQGSHLSGGQQQRLIIARALVENPDLVILDEPTSSLDVRSESLIRETLNGLRSSTTVIIIAHRLSTLTICDRIMVIQGGQLRAFDTPSNLERDNVFFREALELSGLR